MTNRHPRPVHAAVRSTRRWTAGVLLASTLAVGGLGLHLADVNAANKADAHGAAVAVPATSTNSLTALSSSSSHAAATTTRGS